MKQAKETSSSLAEEQRKEEDEDYKMSHYMTSMDSSRGCSILMMVLLSTPRMLASMCWAAQFSALNSYLENLISSEYVLALEIIGPFTGFFISPIIGFLSDTCTSKYGRRRPFLVAGALLLCVIFTLMACSKQIGKYAGDTEQNRPITALIAGLTFIGMGTTVNVIATPAHLILSDFAGDRQTSAAAIGQAAFTFGSLFVSIYIKIRGPPAQDLWWFLGYLQSVMFLIILFVCIYAKEECIADRSQTKVLTNSRQTIIAASDSIVSSESRSSVKITSVPAMLVDIFRNLWTGIRQMPFSLIILGIIFFCRCYGSTSYHGAKSMFFGKVVVPGQSENADICGDNCSPEQQLYNEGAQIAGGDLDIIFSLVCYVASWCVPTLVRWIGGKNVILFGMFPQTLFIAMAYLKDKTWSQVIVASTAVTMALVDSMLVPIIVHATSKNLKEKDIGIYVGVFNSFDCFGQLLNYGVSALLVGGAITKSERISYSLPIFVGGGISLIGFFVALFFLKIKLNKV